MEFESSVGPLFGTVYTHKVNDDIKIANNHNILTLPVNLIILQKYLIIFMGLRRYTQENQRKFKNHL